MIPYLRKSTLVKILNSKMAVVIMIMFLMSWQFDQPYLEYVKQVNHPVSWCIFPFILSSHRFMAIFFFCMIYINTDVPFNQHTNMYQLIRTGRIPWAAGQVAGMILRYLFAVVMTAVMASLPFLGRMEFTDDWGKVIYTLADINASWDFRLSHDLMFRFSYEVLFKYTPVQLMLLTISLCLMICIFLGLVMFFLSLFFDRIIAVSGALLLVIMLYFVQNAPPAMKQHIAHYVPVYWAAVSLIESPSSGYYRLPSLTYMFTFLGVAIIALMAGIFFRVKHMEFDWENEDI